jgi:colanic acid biosynthesis protein WcaH
MLSNDHFLQAIRDVPLICVDFVVLNEEDEMLVGIRKNRPARGIYFAPGGRIRKNELLADAVNRLSQIEIGMELNVAKLMFLGHYDHIYPNENFFGAPGIGTHCFTCVYVVRLKNTVNIYLDNQHTTSRWVSLYDAANDPSIHYHTQQYAKDLRTLPLVIPFYV